MKHRENVLNLQFNPSPSYVMHIDLNSCFATIEQQANPHLRGKPIAVCAYTTPSGCILAPSIEAKEFGVKTGMRVKDGRKLCPNMHVMNADPNKYRSVHLKFRDLFSNYTDKFYPKSIDEFVLDFKSHLHLVTPRRCDDAMQRVAKEIKKRIKSEIGDWLSVSIGIGPSRFIAKTASNLKKPDGLEEINHKNFLDIYKTLTLCDLHGINIRFEARLNSVGIYTPEDLYRADLMLLKSAFRSISARYWYTRIRGWEIDNVEFGRKSYGNSYSIPKPLVSLKELSPILAKLVEKMGSRLRAANYKISGVHLTVVYRDNTFWHKGQKLPRVLFDSRDIYKSAYGLLTRSPRKPVRKLAVSGFNLRDSNSIQLDIFEDVIKKEHLVKAIDDVNSRWGNFVITSARYLPAMEEVPDRIAFGNIKELEEIIIN